MVEPGSEPGPLVPKPILLEDCSPGKQEGAPGQCGELPGWQPHPLEAHVLPSHTDCGLPAGLALANDALTQKLANCSFGSWKCSHHHARKPTLEYQMMKDHQGGETQPREYPRRRKPQLALGS